MRTIRLKFCEGPFEDGVRVFRGAECSSFVDRETGARPLAAGTGETGVISPQIPIDSDENGTLAAGGGIAGTAYP